jgi:uncharacterized protein
MDNRQIPERTVTLHADGIRLNARIYIPPSTGHIPSLCICHGLPSGMAREPGDEGYPALARRFAAAGFATLIFDFRGCGESAGNMDIVGWTHDLTAAIDYLQRLEQVDTARLSVMGFSAGAAVAICVAARDNRVASVVSAACPATFGILSQNPDELIEHFRSIGIIRDRSFPPSHSKWFKGFAEVSPITCIKSISPRPVLIIHGADDDLVPVQQARQLHGVAGEPKSLVLIPGAGHRLRTNEETIAAALDWIGRPPGRSTGNCV